MNKINPTGGAQHFVGNVSIWNIAQNPFYLVVHSGIRCAKNLILTTLLPDTVKGILSRHCNCVTAKGGATLERQAANIKTGKKMPPNIVT